MRIAFVGDSLTYGLPGCSYVDRLREPLAGHTVLNLGRGNDTVIGLYRRMLRWQAVERFDVAVLWVGVNDLSGNGSRLPRWVNWLRGQPRVYSREQFRAYYARVLDLLCRQSGHVIAVSLAVKGEDLDSERNRRGALLSQDIQGLASDRSQATYLDLRSAFARQLDGKAVAVYAPRPWACTARDGLALHGDQRVDRAAHGRGLHLTLDGVHLNSAGATLVAQEVLAALRGLLPELGSGAAFAADERSDQL
jgi:lysophospholipase L1-like esterase